MRHPPPASAPPPAKPPAAAVTADGEDEFTPAEVEPRYLQELERIARRPEVQRAFQATERDEERATRDLIMLTEIPAPPFMEEERARKYLEMLVEAGVDTAYIDSEGNVIGVRRGVEGGSTLVLSGHLDTVFPEGTHVTVRIRGDTLFAPGSGVDTRGLIVVLGVLRAINAAEIRTSGDVWFVGTVGEEGPGDLRPRVVQRIEILRGPAASALYGSSGAAGTIRIYTGRAPEELGAMVPVRFCRAAERG